jgi:hypothetical protein
MNDNLIFETVEQRIITLRGEKILLDSDVAELYGVSTKEVNQSVRNNTDKFPEGYIIETNTMEKSELVKNFDRFNRLKHSTSCPRAFTEKGLYMLATILKSEKATQTTLAIVETYSRIRELSRTMLELADTADKNKQKALMQQSGEIMAELLGDDLHTSGTETSIELNFAVLKFKHTIKRNE